MLASRLVEIWTKFTRMIKKIFAQTHYWRGVTILRLCFRNKGTVNEIKIAAYPRPKNSSGDIECDGMTDLLFWHHKSRTLRSRSGKPDSAPRIVITTSQKAVQKLSSKTSGFVEHRRLVFPPRQCLGVHGPHHSPVFDQYEDNSWIFYQFERVLSHQILNYNTFPQNIHFRKAII